MPISGLHFYAFLVSFPKTLHPMTQMGMAVAALNQESKFAAAYERGVKKTEYWTYTLEDSLNLIAKLPALAARIYRNTYYPEKQLPKLDLEQDLVGMWLRFFGLGSRIPIDRPFSSHRELRQHAWVW